MGRNPWGSSAQSAARWAFNQLANADAVSSVLGNLREGSKGQRELERIELRAQAAAIRGIVERIADPVAMAYLVAFYLPRPQLERSIAASGLRVREVVDRFPEERKRHVYTLAWWLLGQQGTGQHRIRGYQEIVAQYMVNQRSLDRIRALMKMDMNKTGEKRKQCEDLLKDLDKKAHAMLDAELVTRRILEDEYAA